MDIMLTGRAPGWKALDREQSGRSAFAIPQLPVAAVPRSENGQSRLLQSNPRFGPIADPHNAPYAVDYDSSISIAR